MAQEEINYNNEQAAFDSIIERGKSLGLSEEEIKLQLDPFVRANILPSEIARQLGIKVRNPDDFDEKGNLKVELQFETEKEKEKRLKEEKIKSKSEVPREDYHSQEAPEKVETDAEIPTRPTDLEPKSVSVEQEEYDAGGPVLTAGDGIVLINDSINTPRPPDEVVQLDECDPPCGPGQQIYSDVTSSTGFRKCDDCSEVSPLNPFANYDCDELFAIFAKLQAAIRETSTDFEHMQAAHEAEQKNRRDEITALGQAIEVLSAGEPNEQQQRIIIMHRNLMGNLDQEMKDAETAFDQKEASYAAHLKERLQDMAIVQDAIEINDCKEEEEDSCRPPKYYCAPDPIGLGQSYYPDPESPTGYRDCEDCKPIEPKDQDDCNPPCVDGQTYYLDPTSSTGYRSCLDCQEVSVIDDGKDNVNVHGEVIDINTIISDTVFSGTIYQPQTLTYNEQVKGWTSFKTFYPESALSINNHYYTWSNGEMWQHHLNPRRNNFYGVDANSTVDLIFNDAPSSVKGFQTVKYEGSQSRVLKFAEVVMGGVTYTDKEYYNLTSKPGWYVSYIETDLQTGKVPEFINKEGKWFNAIKGDCTDLENVDEREFSVQGIGFGSFTHSDPNSEAPEPVRKEIQIKDSGSDIDGTLWD